MAAIPRPTLNRIPGGDVGLPQAKENHAKDLTKLSQVELLEIKDREGKLLADKKKLNRLPDKGKRIQEFYDKVIAELERRANVDEAAALFSELNIATRAKNALNEIEWSGKINGMNETDPLNDVIDSDDEIEMDPLRIIAKGNMHERKTKIVPAEPSLITAEDLAEIATFNSGSNDSGLETLRSSNDPQEKDNESTDSASETSIVDAELVAVDVGEKLDSIKSKLNVLAKHKYSAMNGDNSSPLEEVEQHVRYLVTKTELQPIPKQREQFKPYKTTISDVHAPEKERIRNKGKHWEITAATPPPIQHNATQLLSLLDSVKIQENYLAKMKELQEQQAAERLAAKIDRLAQRNMQLPSAEVLKQKPAFNKYRSVPTEYIEGAHCFNENDEIHDTLDEGRPRGGIVYPVNN